MIVKCLVIEKKDIFDNEIFLIYPYLKWVK